MATFTKFHSFAEAVAEKKHDLGSDTLKIMLTNTAPTAASDTQKSNLTEIAAGNGYTAGGATVNVTASSQTSGTYKLVGDDVTFTASGGSIGPYQYAVLYNDTSTNDLLIGYWDYGSANTTTDGNSFKVDLNQISGILTLA